MTFKVIIKNKQCGRTEKTAFSYLRTFYII